MRVDKTLIFCYGGHLIRNPSMRKILLLPLFAIATLVSLPFLNAKMAAETRDWSAFADIDTWVYDDYQVDAVFETSLNLNTFGDALVLVKRAESCDGSCDVRDLAIISEGGYVYVTDVPTAYVDEQTIAFNDDRLVYATYAVGSEQSTIDVVEVDLTTGERTTLVNDGTIPLTSIDSVDLNVDGDIIYVTINDRLYGYHAYNNSFQKFFNHLDTYVTDETLVAAEDGEAIANVEFTTGEEQLWLYTYVSNGPQGAQGLAGTWTVSGEDIVGVHFTDEGYIEYFRQFARQLTSDTSTTSSDPWETESFKQYMSWYRDYDPADLTNIVQIDGSVMAWVDPTNHLYVSNSGEVSFIASIGEDGTFMLDGDRILWSTGRTGGVSDLDGAHLTTLDFMPTDTFGDIVVGTDRSGNVIYLNLDNDESLTLGTGTSPSLSSAQYAYWRGNDARLYQATVYLPHSLDLAVGTPVKVSSSPRVYMVTDEGIAFIPNEYTYYTWYSSFEEVETVTSATLASYTLLEDELGLKPSTLLVIDGSSKVYMMGSDGELHWIVDGDTAESLFGSDWTSLVRGYSSAQLLRYDFGDAIRTTSADFADTVRMAIE